LGVNLPKNAFTDDEVRKELKAESHEETHARLDAMSDEELKRFVEYLQWKMDQQRKRKKRSEEGQVQSAESGQEGKEEVAAQYIS
jgi:hypothetical protein